MALGDIHNHNGTVCKAEKGKCPFGDDGHSKDLDSYVEHHVRESGVDGDAVRAMISDGTPPADAIEVAKSGEMFLHAVRKPVEAAPSIDPKIRKVISEGLEAEDWNGLGTIENLSKLSNAEWKSLLAEQDSKVERAKAKLAAFDREIGYSEDSKLDYMALSDGKTLDDLRAEIRKDAANLTGDRSNYIDYRHRENSATLARLEKIVKPGEERKLYETKAAQMNRRFPLREEYSKERRKAGFLRQAVELTDQNRIAPDGTRIPVGYTVQPAAYTIDGELLGSPGNPAFPPKIKDSKGKEYTIRRSNHQDPAEAKRRDAQKGLIFGEMLTPSKISNERGLPTIIQRSQTKQIRSLNIGLKI